MREANTPLAPAGWDGELEDSLAEQLVEELEAAGYPSDPSLTPEASFLGQVRALVDETNARRALRAAQERVEQLDARRAAPLRPVEQTVHEAGDSP